MPTVGGLRLFVDPDDALGRKHTPWDEAPKYRDCRRLEPGSDVFDATGFCIDLALSIHETRAGRTAMASVGRSVIRGWDDHRQRHIYNDSLNNMQYWVGFFLDRVRRDFPNVYITGVLPAYGETQRTDWRWHNLTDFNPKLAAIMFLQRYKVDTIIYIAAKYGQLAHQNRAAEAREVSHSWDTALFALSKTIAHELLHVFVGFLRGSFRRLTPPNATHPGHGTRDAGESGRMWEGILFDGIPRFMEDAHDRLGERQAGIPYLTDIGGDDHCRKISQAWVGDLVRGRFHFPATLSSSTHSMRLIDFFRSLREVIDLHEEAMARTVRPEMVRRGMRTNHDRGRPDASRRDIERINSAPSFDFRASRYRIPGMA